mgnify:FL=1
MVSGKFAEAVSKGRVYSVSTVVAGLAIPISTTTAPTVMLWNPLDSGVMVNLLRYNIAHASGNTTAAVIGLQAIGGNQSGAVKGITAFADSPAVNTRLDGGVPSQIKASAAGTNTILAVVNWMCTMFVLEADTIATTAGIGGLLSYDFDGLVQVPPGYAVFPAGSAAPATLFSQTLYWEEVPLADL